MSVDHAFSRRLLTPSSCSYARCVPCQHQVKSATCLEARYAMPGTDLAHVSARSTLLVPEAEQLIPPGELSANSVAAQCPV
eukprot:2440258-Rhodomonas_salina.6